jgi:hypothetical protein
MRRFVRWRDNGENSVNERGCFDVGNATNAALNRWRPNRMLIGLQRGTGGLPRLARAAFGAILAMGRHGRFRRKLPPLRTCFGVSD